MFQNAARDEANPVEILDVVQIVDRALVRR
jgi:hypothetical protein